MTMWFVHVSIFLRMTLFLGTSKSLKVPSFEVKNSCINHHSTCPTSCLNSRCHFNNCRVICTDGCEEGRRGDNCSLNCPPKCSDCSKYPGDSCEELCLDNCEGGCDRYKWQCARCKPGFTGRFCDTCMKGFRGSFCNEKCPDYCHDGCERNSGFCSWKEDAYRGRYCIKNSSEFCLECESSGLCKHCFSHVWGNICNNTCPTYCRLGCDSQTGLCGCRINGYWGEFCNQTCPSNCDGFGCDRHTGRCLRCNDGYWGNFCNQTCIINCDRFGCNRQTGQCGWCANGYWGEFCNQTCRSNCDRFGCNRQTGQCRWCANGYWGEFCNQTCPSNCDGFGCDRHTGRCLRCNDGYWGNFCNQTCIINCDRFGCNRQTGQCGWCANGYWGEFCNQTCRSNCDRFGCNRQTGQCRWCANGYWGEFCNQTCPSNCDGFGCDRHTGRCLRCNDGYWGNFCNLTCIINCDRFGCNRQTGQCGWCANGYWGEFCDQTCPNNCNRFGCLRHSGQCLRCNHGYWGYFCNQTCPNNCGMSGCHRFSGECRCDDGNNCNKICPTNCGSSSCNIHTGKCSGCRHGYWGNICSQTCSTNCERSRCDMDTGQCRRCVDGYMGSYCNITCPPNCISCRTETGHCIGCKNGYRGHFCNMSCSRHCSLCDRFTGDCYGCKTGYQGGYCNETCPSNCKGGCNRYTGVCVACEDGYAGKHCNSACPSGCEICDFDTGLYCVSCNNGKKGRFCNCPTTCVSCDPVTGQCTQCANLTFYGDSCAIPCPRACAGCEKATGSCVNCAKGYSRVYCDEMCTLCSQPQNCISNQCVHRGSQWLWKVLVGTLSSFCIIAVSVLVWVKQARKLRGSDDEQAEQGSIVSDPPDPHEYHLPSNHYHEIANTGLESGSAPEVAPLSQSLCPPLPEPRSKSTNNPKVITQEIQHLDSIVSNSPSLPCTKPLISNKERSSESKKDQGNMKLGADPLSLPPPFCPRPNVIPNESHTYPRRKLQENVLHSSDNVHGTDKRFLHPTFLLPCLLSQQEVYDRSRVMEAHLSYKCQVSDHLAINPPLCPRSQMLGGNNEIPYEEKNQNSYSAKDFISRPASSQLRMLQQRESLEPVSPDTSAQSHIRSRNLLPNRKSLFAPWGMLMEMPSHEPALSFVFEANDHEVFENHLYRKSAASASNSEKVDVDSCNTFDDHNGFRKENYPFTRKRNIQASELNQHHWFLQRRFSDSDLPAFKCITTDSNAQIKRSKSDVIKGENAYFCFNALTVSLVSLNKDFIASNSTGMYITPLLEQHLPPNEIK